MNAPKESSPIRDALASLFDRTTNPVTGTFILVWLIVNWRVPVILIFGSEPAKDRTLLIQTALEPDSFLKILQIYVLPVILTAIYLFLIPWLKERYLNWLNRVNFRINRNRLIVENDLNEEREYRQTIAAICGLLKKEISESQKAFEQIAEHAQSGQDPTTGDFYSQIKSIADLRIKRNQTISKQLANFFNNYSGELPDTYKWFFEKWITKKTN